MGKFTNAGQTCVAPDYLLVNKRIKAKLIDKMERTFESEFYHGDDPSKSPGLLWKNYFREAFW